MKRLLILLLFIGLQLFFNVFAQDLSKGELVTIDGQKYILHKVEQGETLFSLAKKYEVEQKDLLSVNPQLIFGLKQGDVLKIPVQEAEKPAEVKQPQEILQAQKAGADDFIFHVVQKSETVYSISRQYNVAIESIYKYNPESANEILENEILRIPKGQKEETEVSGLMREDDDFYYHQVQPKETVYSLSRKYNVKVADIFELNPLLGDYIEIGQIVRIPKTEIEDQIVDEETEDKDFFMHLVESGDTFYSYKRRFDVSKEQLIGLNPQLADGLQTGQSIKIPVQEKDRVDVTPVHNDNFYRHKVKGGETLFAISQEYSIQIPQIRAFNPDLNTRGLIAGETILIPKKPSATEQASESVSGETDVIDVKAEKIAQMKMHEVVIEVKDVPDWIKCKAEFEVISDDTFRISMFLPLFFEMNDSINRKYFNEKELAELDSLKAYDDEILEKYFKIEVNSWGSPVDTVLIKPFRLREERRFYSSTHNFVNFYQGFLLGIDSLQKAGVNIHLDLYDSELDKNVVDSILYTHDFINSNLIVGPVIPEIQKSVSDFSNKNRIPLVSPFSNDDRFLKENPYYFQVNPSKDYLLKKTSDFIGDAFYDKNFIVMTLGETEQLKEADLVTLVRDKFFASGIYNNLNDIRFTMIDFTKGGHMGYWQVKRNLKPDMENIIFIPATENPREREALLSRAINSLQVLAEEFNITLIGVSDYPRFRSINTEYFHRLKLHYLTPNYVDYSSRHVNVFLKKYRESFFSEPDQYSFRGYDVAMFFIDAYAKMGNGFIECVEEFNTGLLQGNFNFQRVDELSGYMNHTLNVMHYTPEYEVKRISTVTEGRLLVGKN